MELITNERFKMTIKYFRALLIISFIIAFLVGLITLGLFIYAKIQGGPPLTVTQSTIFYDDDGAIIGENHHGQKRYWVPLEEISPFLIQATLSIEDKTFFDHHGFDYKRIAGAVVADIKARAKVQGASTITQQYAKNLFLESDKTFTRKLAEALYTIRLEANYSKKQILEGYLNTIYYGHGAYGIEAASFYYFGKSADSLNLSEAAMLAGIPKGPSIYSPFTNMTRAKMRQKTILLAMAQQGKITKKQALEAYEQKLNFVTDHDIIPNDIAPYFQQVVRDILKTEIGLSEKVIDAGGLHIYTTLNQDMQKIAEEKMKEIINPMSDIQVGFMAMDPKNGEVKALIGGRDFETSKFNRAYQAERQPGSTIKPLLYYAALKNGFTPSTELRSEITTFTYDNGKSSYTPHNYNNYYANDTITLAQAIALSDNVYAVKTHMFLGMDELIHTAKEFGITSKLAKVPSLALGTSPVKLIDMVNAYSIIANNGKQVKPVFIKKIVNQNGDVIYEQKNDSKQILDPNLAFVTSQLMTGMFDPKLNDYTHVTGSSIIKQLTRHYAGKSGSTETDSWMIGFTPQLVAGVWTGYDKGKTIDVVEERSYAKKIWAQFMEEALSGKPVLAFTPPKDVIGVYVNPDNGKLATKDCPIKRLTYYVKGTEPKDYCNVHLDKHDKKKKKKKKEKKEEKGWFEKILDIF